MVTGMAHGARGEGKTAGDAVRGRMLRNAVTSPPDRFSKWDSGRCTFAKDNLSVVGYAFGNPVMRSIPWSSSLGRQWT